MVLLFVFVFLFLGSFLVLVFGFWCCSWSLLFLVVGVACGVSLRVVFRSFVFRVNDDVWLWLRFLVFGVVLMFEFVLVLVSV